MDPARLRSGLLLDEACELVPERHWSSTSRNWWYQGLLERILRVYPGFDALNYLLCEIAAVAPDSVRSRAELIRCLLSSIAQNPEPFSGLDYTEDEHEVIRQQVVEAKVSRDLDDDCRFAHGNFFSYLLSQAAALDEAREKGWALLSLQFQPDRSEERLIWPA